MLARSFHEAAALYTIEAGDAVPGYGPPNPPGGPRPLPCHEGRWVLDWHLRGARGDLAVSSLYHDVLRGPLRPLDDAYLERMRDALLEAVEQRRLVVVEQPIVSSGSIRPEDAPEAPPPPVQREPPKLVDLWVRLEIDPNDASSCGDTFVVSATDGSYRQSKTVKDDKVPGDVSVDLEYTDLFPDKQYSLQVIPAKGPPRYVFQGVPYAALEGYGQAQPEPPYVPRDHDPTPEEVGS